MAQIIFGRNNRRRFGVHLPNSGPSPRPVRDFEVSPFNGDNLGGELSPTPTRRSVALHCGLTLEQ